MECPHCQEDLPSRPCVTCGHAALPGAAFCHHCGYELPPAHGEEPKLLTCHSCGQKLLPEAKFCSDCGQSLSELSEPAQAEAAEGYDPGKRTACSDGSCIGIIGPDGKCTDCSKPYSGPAQ